MKKVLLFSILVFINLSLSFSQGNTCGSATPFCGNACFPNNINTTAPVGPSYGCLGSEPNPEWFFIKTTGAGTMNFTISQNTSGCLSGSAIDVDFICWGPFASLANACTSLTGSCTGDHACTGNIVDCSYSTAGVETMNIPSPGAGNYYLILITNYANANGYINFHQNSGPATDCSVVCPTVLGGNGYNEALAGGGTTPMPASVACNSGDIPLIASNNSPFGNPITPGIMITFNDNANASNWIQWYENGSFILCDGPPADGCGINLTTNTNNQVQFSTMSPSATNAIWFCETAMAGQPNMPYTIVDVSSGVTLNSGTWVNDGSCQVITFPPGTITGVASWSISPACPGCLSSTDWGFTVFHPSLAGPGTYNICYSFDPPGACPTYTYCQNITVTNPYTATWTTPPAMCSSAAPINLNTFITGTAGGTWSGTGVSGSTFNPAGLNGTYAITYTVGSLPCGATVTHNITVNPTPTATATAVPTAICSGSTATINLTGGGTYAWGPVSQVGATGATAGSGTPISQVLTATGGAAGTVTYSVTATSGGCTSAPVNVTVTVNPIPTVAISPASSTICAGASATLTATPVSPAGGTYLWAPGGATTNAITVSPAATTTYTVTYTVSGCSGTATRVITVNPQPTAAITVAPASATICSGTSATLTASSLVPAGGTYSWAPGGATTNSITVSPASTTTYTLTYTVGSCFTTVTQTITVNPTPTATPTPVSASICSGTAPTINLTGGGTYAWGPTSQVGATGASAGSGTPISQVLTATGAAAGTVTYSVTATSGGCTSAPATITITVNPIPTVAIAPAAAVSICAGSSTTLTATPVSPAGGTYSWAPGGATTSSITVSPASTTTYTVTYTVAGCSSTATKLITVNPIPTVAIAPAAAIAICAGGSATLTATPVTPAGGTYLWAPGGATTSSITVSPAATTTYTVTYTANGCSATATKVITVNPVDNASFSYPSSTFCQTGANPSATITGTAGGTFTAAPAGLVINSATGTINLAGSALGSYNVTYTTSGVCPANSTVAITIVSAPSATFSYAGPYCQNSANPSPTFPAGASAGTFSATPAGLVFVNVNTGQINLTTSAAGTYTITNTIPASGGCAAATATFTITINAAPVISTTTSPPFIICSGSVTAIGLASTLGAATNYTWGAPTQAGATGGAAGSGSAITQALTATGSSPGTVTYTVTSSYAGCPGNTLSIVVTVNPTPTEVGAAGGTICSGAATNITLNGPVAGTTYTWTTAPVSGVTGASGGSGAIGSTIAQTLSYSSAPGTVQYNITPSANGCTGPVVSVTYTVNPIPFGVSTTVQECSGVAGSFTFTSFVAGTTFTWAVPTYTGSISGGVAGSSATTLPYTLTNSATTMGTAVYTITPTAGGCTGTPFTLTVQVQPVAHVNPGAATASICSGSTTSINLVGPTTPAGTTFTWSAPTYSGSVSGGSAGSGSTIAQTLTNAGTSAGTATYTVTPTANSCSGPTQTVVVTVNPNPTITATPVSSTICSGTSVTIPISTTITGGATFTWTVTSSGVTGASAGSGTTISQVLTTTGTTAGTVTYTINSNSPAGCTATTSVVITVNPTPVASSSSGSSVTICSGTATNITLTTTPVVAGTTYTWGPTAVSGVTGASAGSGSTIAQTLTATGTSPGTLTYTITPTASACSGSPISVNVTVNPTPVITPPSATETFCTGGTTNFLLASNVPGTTISWTVVQTNVTGGASGSGVNITDALSTTGASSGTAVYTITSSASGCPGSPVTATANVNPIDNASFTYGSSTYCQSGTDPSATITGLPGGTFTVAPAGLVLLNPSTGLLDLSASVPGTYSVTYQTAGACPNNSSITLTISNAPQATFSYATPFCSSDINPLPTFPGGSSGGVFSSTAGLVFVNTNTGEINLSGSTPGTYVITNTIAAAGGCSASTDTASITINPAAITNAGADGSICQASAYPLTGTMSGSATSITWTTSGSGTFSNVSSLTSTYTPSSADVAAGTVTLYLTSNNPPGVCSSGVDSLVLTVTPLDNAAFSYSGSTFCASGANPTPVITGMSGGTFSSSPAGLSLNTSTGLITLSTSTLGTYSVYYTTNGTCPNTDTASVTITNAPIATFSFTAGAVAFCQSAPDPTPIFGAGASAGVFTSSPAGLSFVSTSTGQIDLSASATGTYVVTNSIAAAGGCASSVDSMTVTIDPPAIIEAGANASVCAGSSYPVVGDSIGGSTSTLTWTSSGTGTFSSTSSLVTSYTPSAADIAAGSVTLTITSDDPAGACGPVSDSFVLTINPTPPAPSVVTTSINSCFGSPVPPVTATGTGGTLTWYSDAGLTTVIGPNPLSPGSLTTNTSYWVAETIGTCQGPATMVTVTVHPLPIADTASVILTGANCGGPTGSITGVAMTSGASPFSYQWTDGTGANVGTGTANLSGVGPGVYSLTVTDANGCSVVVGPYTVLSTAGVTASFTPNPTTGETPLSVNFTNTSTGAVSYLWEFGTGDTSTVVSPTYIYVPLGSFTACLIAYNAAGCADTACSSIDIYINSVFVIPNIFSPNDDGTNDIFTVHAIGLATMHAEVYNRWGQKLYEWNTTNGGWDGRTTAGVLAPEGTYFFIIKATGIDGKDYFEKGPFQLVR